MKTPFYKSPIFTRLLTCLVLGFILALMVGPQQGSTTDLGYSFREAVKAPRIFLFLGIGLLGFVLVTFWPAVKPYLVRPGVRPFAFGLVTVIASLTLLHWYDPLGDGKFSTLAEAAADTPQLQWYTAAYFAWLAWASVIGLLILTAIAVVLRLAIVAWLVVLVSIAGAVFAVISHNDILFVAGGIDHSLGSGVAVIGYLTVAASGVSIALTKTEVADPKAFVAKVLGWRPGLGLVVIGLIIGLLGYASATWFSPGKTNATLVDTAAFFEGSGLAPLASMYLNWLGLVLFAVTLILAAAACYLRSVPLGWVTAGLGIVSVFITVYTMYLFTSVQVTGSGKTWQNLGTGGWMASGALLLLAGAGYIAASVNATGVKTKDAVRINGKLMIAKSSDKLAGGFSSIPGGTKTLIIIAIAAALFYPPTANTVWQNVLVSQIGIYVLLAVGLNVVVGWAGLLDLGFIAFYAIGSYVTAYLVGSLPVKPPSWLLMSPLLAIPFAILACLIAGVALGTPTLRLRGDYLAIVTMGFGEIIRIAAVNADGITNSTRGPSPNVPHPVVDVGFARIEWGLDNLQYWYLLLVIVGIVVILFHRLEDSRTGRAWAAIREDEIAAQATGVNTTRVKLLAFAIGASTSGLAGVFFASQVGFFTPDNFLLNNSILVVAYVVFGGMGSLPGAMAGAAVLTWLPEFLKDQVPAEDRTLWIGLVILLMMIFRPGGLIPAKRRKAELDGYDNDNEIDGTAVPAGEGMGVKA